ncbi:UNVERIFIED_CONTAM: hypothetical protein RMT77_019779 [Armadillidium vulgare]
MSVSAGIEITDIFVPRVRLVGDDAELECRFLRSNGVRVYSIKWWRDNDQFYQYIPRNEPPKMPFNVSGIRVDTSLSSEVKVILRHVTVDTSGAFTCEVMADESFETVRKSSNMTVIDPPDGEFPGTVGPVIKVSGVGIIRNEPLEYEIGKIIEAACYSHRAFPPSILTWLINGREAAEDFLTRFHPRQESRNSFTSELWLTFTVTNGLFDQNGELVLICNASLGPFYHSHSTLILTNSAIRRAHNSELGSFGYLPKSSLAVIAFSLIFILLNMSTEATLHSPNDLSSRCKQKTMKRNYKGVQTPCIKPPKFRGKSFCDQNFMEKTIYNKRTSFYFKATR